MSMMVDLLLILIHGVLEDMYLNPMRSISTSFIKGLHQGVSCFRWPLGQLRRICVSLHVGSVRDGYGKLETGKCLRAVPSKMDGAQEKSVMGSRGCCLGYHGIGGSDLSFLGQIQVSTICLFCSSLSEAKEKLAIFGTLWARCGAELKALASRMAKGTPSY